MYPEIVMLLVIILLTGCSSGPLPPVANVGITSTPSTIPPAYAAPGATLNVVTPQSIPTQSTPIKTNITITPVSTLSPVGIAPTETRASPTQLPPDYWMSLPVLPTLGQTARDIYQRGIELGRDPHAFSKIGDCQSILPYFLSYFDQAGLYNLGPNSSLQETIDWFSGSFSRQSLAVRGGFNAAAVLSPLRADPKQCHADENPIACEFRVHNPSFAIISLEEWWEQKPENYEKYLRQIIEYSIQQGVVPIVATKADNLEGNHVINRTIARLAFEYDIPLWNFWLAVQPLPSHGLIAKAPSGEVDMFHLTRREGYYFYNDRIATHCGWSVRNLTALQSLDVIRRDLIEQP